MLLQEDANTRHAELLTMIAQKERRVNELREGESLNLACCLAS